MDNEFNYYEDQLNRIDFHSEYKPLIKIKGTNTETKWMDLNKESAKRLVEKLIDEFKIKIS